MLSLPTMTPRADASLWPSLRTSHPTFDADAGPSSPTHPNRRQNTHHHAHGDPNRSFFAQLAVDENKQKQRNANIRNFGATWIRPPGVQKTYQAMMDEEKELKEQEELAQREQRMMDLAAAQQEAQNAEARAQAGEDMEEERDLDEDVPEAEASESELSVSDSAGEEDQEGDTRVDVTFNEDSFIEGSMVEGQVEHMLAMEEASMEGALMEERDLDDDVPEAGEYEHTDSSLLESSEEEEVTQASFVAPGTRRSARRGSGPATRTSGLMQAPAQMRVPNSRMSVELEGSSSILDGSSFLRSSPAAPRGSVRARLFGARNGR